MITRGQKQLRQKTGRAKRNIKSKHGDEDRRGRLVEENKKNIRIVRITEDKSETIKKVIPKKKKEHKTT